MDNLIPIGKYNKKFNDILGLKLPCSTIYKTQGVEKHIKKRHPEFIKYMEYLPDIIKNPDYIGTNKKEPNSIELIKVFDVNILVAVKLDMTQNYLFVASLYDVKQDKIERRLHSNRIKKYEK